MGLNWHNLRKTQVTNRKTTSFAWKLLSHFELYFYKRIQQIKKDLHAQENETVFLLMNRKKILCMCKFQIVVTGVPWRHSQFILHFVSKISFNCKKEHRIVRTTQSMRRRKVDRGDRWLIKVPPDITTGRISKEEEHLFLEKWRKSMSAALHPILKLAIDSFFMLCNMVVKIWCKKQRNIAFSCLVLVRGGVQPPRPWP